MDTSNQLANGSFGIIRKGITYLFIIFLFLYFYCLCYINHIFVYKQFITINTFFLKFSNLRIFSINIYKHV